MYELKLGKKPARPGAVKLSFGNYVNKAALPKHPLGDFGHDNAFPPKSWGMLGNDQVGNCFFAGSAHETMLWNKLAGHPVSFTADNVISDYSACTGYKPGDASTDGGTDIVDGAKYRQKVGIVDSAGKRHQIAAYLSLRPGDIEEHLTALYLCDAIGIGIIITSGMMDQFNAGQPWDISTAPGASNEEGGHYIPMIARRSNMQVVTWGAEEPLTMRAFCKYNDESLAYLTEESLVNRKSPEGFDYDQLIADLKSLTA